jgi:hypothetical protein
MTPEQYRPTEEVLRRVQGEFLEMPGLRLTEAQARRLWGLDTAACDALLRARRAKFYLERAMGVHEIGPPLRGLAPGHFAGAPTFSRPGSRAEWAILH